MSESSPRVIIADDAVLIREGIRQLLTAGGCEVVAVVGSVHELDAVLATTDDIDAIVLDIRMPPTHTDEGIRALEALRSSGSRVGILLLSMYASPTLAIRAMSGGPGTGYLIKDRVTDGDTLVAAVRTVMKGGAVVDPEVVAQLVAPAHPNPQLDDLTDREREVLTLMAQGRSNLGIASRMHVSPRTVETHVAHIMTKLGIEPARDEHRRVLTVLRALRSSP